MQAVRNHALLPGPGFIWESRWVGVLATVISAEDVCCWPYSIAVRVKWVAFLGTLHWPADEADLGVGECPASKCAFCMNFWAGERLVLEQVLPSYWRPGRPISVSVVPCGSGTDNWRSCRFIECA